MSKKSVLLILLTLFSIITIFLIATNTHGKSLNQHNDHKTIKIECVMNEVEHGLNKVQLDDSTTILIYRGTESSAMIQLK